MPSLQELWLKMSRFIEKQEEIQPRSPTHTIDTTQTKRNRVAALPRDPSSTELFYPNHLPPNPTPTTSTHSNINTRTPTPTHRPTHPITTDASLTAPSIQLHHGTAECDANMSHPRRDDTQYPEGPDPRLLPNRIGGNR